MNIRKNRLVRRRTGMAFQLWGMMMAPVVLTVFFMWLFQIHFMEDNYITSSITEINQLLGPLTQELGRQDLADNDRLISALSNAADGKLMVIDNQGRLTALYSYGLPIRLEDSTEDIQVWESIRSSGEYQKILQREPYSLQREKRGRIVSYEIGIPVQYQGQEAYLLLYHSFSELYSVLDMNRRQLVIFSVLLTLAAALLAGLLSKRFTRPLLTIKKTVNRLAAGDLSAVPDLSRSDEIGQLAHSVEELGQALQRVERLRREVIANVSHELRSPLSLIAGYAEMVRDITWEDPEHRTQDLDLIISEARRMSEMVDDIMDYSQFQSGYLQLKMEDYDLAEIVVSETLRYERTVQENHLSLKILRAPGDYPIRADALKLGQVIRNLLNNAINHSQDGHTVTVTIARTGGAYRVSVINPGDPIPDEEKALIWERYQRSQHQGGRRQGTGIGLSIVSAILDAHGMNYGVECRNGLICFWFSCPA